MGNSPINPDATTIRIPGQHYDAWGKRYTSLEPDDAKLQKQWDAITLRTNREVSLNSSRKAFMASFPEYAGYLKTLKSRGYDEKTAYRLLKRKMDEDGIKSDFVDAKSTGELKSDNSDYVAGIGNSTQDQTDTTNTDNYGPWSATQTTEEGRIKNLANNGLNWNRWTTDDQNSYLTMTDKIRTLDPASLTPMTVVKPSAGVQTGINNGSGPTQSGQPPK